MYRYCTMGIRHLMVRAPRQIMTVIYSDNMYKTSQHDIDFPHCGYSRESAEKYYCSYYD